MQSIFDTTSEEQTLSLVLELEMLLTVFRTLILKVRLLRMESLAPSIVATSTLYGPVCHTSYAVYCMSSTMVPQVRLYAT